jgi:hypothetical protein
LTYAGDGILVARRASVTLSRHGHRTPTLERDVEVDPGLERYGSSMTTATLLASVLAVAPQPQPPPFEVVDVEFEQTADTAQLTAFDSDGEVVGELVVWRDSTGQPMIAVTFSDGLYMFVSVDGEDVDVGTENATVVGARLQQINAAVQDTTDGAEWVPCAHAAGLAALDCVMLRPILCGIATFVATCECLDLAVEGDTSCWD